MFRTIPHRRMTWAAVPVLIAVVGLVGSACGGSSSTSSSSSTTAVQNSAGGTAHVFEGTTNSGNTTTATVDCSPGYVQRDPSTNADIFDAAHVSLDGSASGVTHTAVVAENSVAWGHVGSRLATKVSTSAASSSHPITKLHYKLTLYCTTTQDDAWVIAG